MRAYRKRKAEVPPVPPRQFIKIWQEAVSLGEVAAKVRRNKNACRVRAFRYRQLGVPLKEFPPTELEPTDWEELGAYAASLLPAGREGDDGDGARRGPQTPG